MTVTVSGPLFDGDAESGLAAAQMQIRDALAAQAFADWHSELNANLGSSPGARERKSQPTPYYEAQINIQNTSDTSANVNDRKVIYGPWLEGLGSRNYPRTVFRGYSSMRKAAATTQARAADLAQPIIDHVVRDINGS